MKRCDACLKYFESLDRAHVKTRGAGAGWGAHEYIHLCRHCHMVQSHLNWKRFLDKYPHLIHTLGDKGWELREEFGVFKVRRKT